MTTRITMTDLAVASLGPCRIDSPLRPLIESRKTNVHYVEEDDPVLFADTAGIVTCGGCIVSTASRTAIRGSSHGMATACSTSRPNSSATSTKTAVRSLAHHGGVRMPKRSSTASNA